MWVVIGQDARSQQSAMERQAPLFSPRMSSKLSTARYKQLLDERGMKSNTTMPALLLKEVQVRVKGVWLSVRPRAQTRPSMRGASTRRKVHCLQEILQAKSSRSI